MGVTNWNGRSPLTASWVTEGLPAGAQAAVLLMKYLSCPPVHWSLLSPNSQRTEPSRSSVLIPASRSMDCSGVPAGGPTGVGSADGVPEVPTETPPRTTVPHGQTRSPASTNPGIAVGASTATTHTWWVPVARPVNVVSNVPFTAETTRGAAPSTEIRTVAGSVVSGSDAVPITRTPEFPTGRTAVTEPCGRRSGGDAGRTTSRQPSQVWFPHPMLLAITQIWCEPGGNGTSTVNPWFGPRP